MGEYSKIEYIRDLEKELLESINHMGLGPAGLGGKVTALGVNIETYPTHIAGMPVAVNISCHVNRHKKFGVYLSIRLLVVGPADPITCPGLAGEGPK